jgi:hypothetical protein
LTRGRAATPEPFDLGAVAGSDELFETLSTRRTADLSAGDDPAAALLAALVADVDAGAPPLPTPARVGCGMPAGRRRGVRAVVTFGVAALVLTSAGVAAAGGGGTGIGAMHTTHSPARPKIAERSNTNAQQQVPVTPSVTAHRPEDRHPDLTHQDPTVAPKSDPSRPVERLRERTGPWRSGPHTPSGTPTPTPAPSWGPASPSPTPVQGGATATP